MGKLRTALQAYALEGHAPAGVLERLHRLLESQHPDSIATVAYLVLDPDEQTVEFANAGHLPPLVRDSEGSSSFLTGTQAPPLGAVPYPGFEQDRVPIDSGSTLALFTDGLVERRGTSLTQRLEALRRVVEEGPTAPDGLCEAALGEMLAGQSLDDDVALLALKLEPLAEHGFARDFKAEPEVLAKLRRLVERWLEHSPASPSEVYAIKAATVEACANAIEHAYRPGDAAFRVITSRTGNEVSVTVQDFGRWRDPRGADRNRGFPLMEALMDSADVFSSPEGSTVRLRRRVEGARGL
jgi:anti-sigma regulatory factor (Ser/Thr protein kinase)